MLILWIYVVIYAFGSTNGCDQPPGWQEQSIVDRANDNSIMVIGTVQDTTDGSGGAWCRSDNQCGYWANIVVECVLKDDTNTISAGSVIKVVGLGDNSDCVQTDIIRNSNTVNYALLLHYADGLYYVNEANGQSAAERLNNYKVETYINEFNGSVCVQTTLAPTTTTPTTPPRPTRMITTTPPVKVTTVDKKMTEQATKMNKNSSPKEKSLSDGSAKNASNKQTISLIISIIVVIVTIFI